MRHSPLGMFRNYTREMNVFIWASMINSTGGALMWPLTTLFVHTQLNRSLADAGFVIFMQMLGGVIGQLLGGGLYYRIGVRRLLIGALAATSVLQFALVITAHADWWIYVTTMTVLGLTNSMSMPAIQSFIGFRWAERREELFNVIYVANNIGVALGTALSGVLADISFNLTFMLNGLTSAAFAVFFHRFLRGMKDEGRAGAHPAAEERAGQNRKLGEAPELQLPDSGVLPERSIWQKLAAYRIYLFMSIGSMFVWLANSLWGTGVAPHIADNNMSFSMYSLLWTLNGVLIFMAQPIISWLKRTIAKPLTAQLTWSAVFYGLAYLVIWFVPVYGGFVLGMVLATLGEMLVSPAVPAFLAARAGREAPFYMGVAGGITSVGRMIGPYVLGIMYDRSGLNGVAVISTWIAAIAVMFFVLHAWVQTKAQNQRKTKKHSFDTYS
ncbi:MFS transporter [Paenibacillus apiarius]|uniref:MFS transporter n=1 Tax=Paenibacillus apiarius TaxID=46240 RepID=UPI001F08CF02|nr:MFS transporter [Paenibacillus apiarius]